MTREQRDKLFTRILLCGLIGALALYALCDVVQIVPAPISVREQTQKRWRMAWKRLEEYRPGDEVDPDLVLGVLIGDTRFRLNWGEHWAMVMRPGDHTLETWVIPERFTYKGEIFLVNSVHSFALLNAPAVKFLSLPRTIVEMNEAETLAPSTMIIEHRTE